MFTGNYDLLIGVGVIFQKILGWLEFEVKVGKNRWFSPFLAFLETKKLRNSNSCQKCDFLFGKLIFCATIIKIEVWSSEQLFLPENAFFPVIWAKKIENDGFLVFLPTFRLTYLKIYTYIKYIHSYCVPKNCFFTMICAKKFQKLLFFCSFGLFLSSHISKYIHTLAVADFP